MHQEVDQESMNRARRIYAIPNVTEMRARGCIGGVQLMGVRASEGAWAHGSEGVQLRGVMGLKLQGCGRMAEGVCSSGGGRSEGAWAQGSARCAVLRGGAGVQLKGVRE